MTRTEALKEAKEFVELIAPSKNDRGYDSGALSSQHRIEQILRVADWLLAGCDGPVEVQMRSVDPKLLATLTSVPFSRD